MDAANIENLLGLGFCPQLSDQPLQHVDLSFINSNVQQYTNNSSS